MATARRIAKNTTISLIAQVIGYIFAFFVTMYSARYLGAGNYGIISLAAAFTSIFGIFADLGLGILTVREVSKDKSLTKKYTGNTILMKIILAIFTFLITFLVVNIIHYSQTVTTVIYIITLSVIFGAFSKIFYSIFQAYEKMEYQSIGGILNGFLMIVGVFLAIYYGSNVIGFAYVYLVASILILIYNIIIFVWKFSLPELEVDWDFWKPTINEAWPFAVIALSGMLYTYIDSIILSLFKGNEVVGWYSAAYGLLMVLIYIPNAANMALFPIMSRFYSSSTDSLKLVYERYFKYMIIIGIPIAFGTTLLAEKIILLIFGQGFTESIIALQILVWTMIFTFAEAAYSQLLQSINKQLIITKITGICLILNILLNLILIPQFSYIGASFVMLLTTIIYAGYIIFSSYKLGYGIPCKIIIKDIIKVLSSSLVMCSFIWYFKDLNLFLLIIICILSYFITLYFVKGVDDIDISILKDIFTRNN